MRSAGMLACLATIVLAGCATPALRVISVGTYSGEFVPVPKLADGGVRTRYGFIDRPRFEGDTTHVFATIGTHFGALFVFDGPQERQKVWYRVVWRYSPDKTGEYRAFYAQDQVTNVGRENTSGIHFNEASQVVEGTFILEIWQQSQKVFRQEFEIAAAKVASN